MSRWRAGDARTQLIFGAAALAIAFALLAATGSALPAVIVIAVGLAARPGDESLAARIVLPTAVVGGYVLAVLAS